MKVLLTGTAFAMFAAVGAGCAVSDDPDNQRQATGELVATTTPSAFVLSLTNDGRGPADAVDVTSSDGTPLRECDGGLCTFAYLAGSTLSLSISNTTDLVNCIRFSSWSGACTGTSTQCTLVLTSDLATRAVWSRILGCVRQ